MERVEEAKRTTEYFHSAANHNRSEHKHIPEFFFSDSGNICVLSQERSHDRSSCNDLSKK